MQRANLRAATLLGAVAALMPGGDLTGPMPRRYRTSKTYPHSSKRQAERYERQRRHFVLLTPSMGLHIKHAGRWWNRDDPNLDRDVRATYIDERMREALARRPK